MMVLIGCGTNVATGTVLWSHPEEVLVRDNGQGEDILRGAIKPHNQNSAGTLYFRIKVDPISDTVTKWIKRFEAGFMLVEKGEEHLGIGNSDGAMASLRLERPQSAQGLSGFELGHP
ncbi:MAG: hypothetical protein QM813_10580 [Verrucomicrobiota bacterium]